MFVGDGEEEKRDGRPAHPAGVALLLLRYYLWRGTDGRAVASQCRSHTTTAATLSLLFLSFFPFRKLFSQKKVTVFFLIQGQTNTRALSKDQKNAGFDASRRQIASETIFVLEDRKEVVSSYWMSQPICKTACSDAPVSRGLKCTSCRMRHLARHAVLSSGGRFGMLQPNF